ncbi:MAG: hypothetical protein PHS42_08665, partial [Sulfurimonas sp.]|nr:hypothetical protein [Sulfurimonas sp.]
IINNSEHKELKSQEIERYEALFYYPITIAILILLIAFNSIERLFRREVSASIFILSILLLSNSPAVGDMFDFKKLADAKRFYEAKEYNSSAKIYEEYAKETDNGQAYYNAGNSYFKQKEYLKALSAYSFARILDKELRAKKLSNMGNALVRLGTINTLERAVKHYEASLRLKDDIQTRENLEAVKRALEEDKEKEEEDKDIEYKEQKTDESGDDSDEADDENNKNKNSKNKGSSKGEKSEDELNPDKKKDSNDAKSKGNEDNSDENSDNDNSSDSNQGQGKELKNKEKKEVQNKGGDAKSDFKPQEMSDLEETKWVNKLNSNQNTYLYRLNKERAENKEKNEKPW